MIIDIIYAFISTAIYIASAMVYGHIIVKATPLKRTLNELNILTKIALCILIGLLIINKILLLLGIIYKIDMYIIILLLNIPVIYILIHFKKLKILSVKLLTEITDIICAARSRLLLISNILFLLIFAVTSLVLLPAGDSDALYMTWAKLMSYTGNIIIQPNYYYHTQIGFSGELHYTVLMILSNHHAASFMVWFIVVIISIVLAQLCRTVNLSYDATHICIFILFTSGVFANIVPHGNVNLFSAAYALSGIYCFIYLNKGYDKWLVLLSGAFLGVSIVSKITYVVVLFPIMLSLILIYIYINNKTLINKQLFTTSFYLLISMCVMLTSLVIKNYFLFSEPFAPLYFFNSENQLFISLEWYSKESLKWIILTYPLAITYGLYMGMGGNISAIIILLIPLLLYYYRDLINSLYKNNEKYIIFILFATLLSLLTWILIYPSILAPRYILISYILLFIPFAKIYDYITCDILRKIVFSSILFIGSLSFLNSYTPITIWMVKNELMMDRSKNYPYYNSIEYINNNIESGSRIFFAGYYSYHMRSDLLMDLQNQKYESYYLDNIDEIRYNFKYLYIQKKTHLKLMKEKFDLQKKNIVYEDEVAIIIRL